jgi:hypothetical protein
MTDTLQRQEPQHRGPDHRGLEHSALERLADFEALWLSDSLPIKRNAMPMGYQPGLDGLRAISVVAVILYHAGFGWMRGGFLGVEVFFVVSGYLITSLLLEEREGSGGVRLRQFWLRRARRLLPALFAVLIAVGAWVALFGTAQQQSDLHRDYLPGIFYVANWGQIFGGAQYFGNFSPLRHLWSLAVEEQWYLLWPLAFVMLTRRNKRTADVGRTILIAAAVVMVITWGLASPSLLTSDRTNFLYLSTLTRSSGLLLGAGAAFLWRPWKNKAPTSGRAGVMLNVAAVAVQQPCAGRSRQALLRGLSVELADLGHLRRLRRVVDQVHRGDVIDHRHLRVLVRLHRDTYPQGVATTMVRSSARQRLVETNDHLGSGGRARRRLARGLLLAGQSI